MNLSNHGYLRPGQWIQLTRDVFLDRPLSFIDPIDLPMTMYIKKGTFARYEGKAGHEMILIINNVEYWTVRSKISYITISPKKSSTLEALYGS